MITHLADVSVRSFMLALFAAAVLWAFRKRASAAMAHAVWSAVLYGMLLLFALASVIPPLSLRIVPPAAAAQSALVTIKSPDFDVARPVRAGIQVQPAIDLARPARRLELRDIALVIYLGTALFFAARLMTGWRLIRKLISVSAATGFRDVYESACVAVPFTIGWVKPKILLPSGWRDWDSAKLDAILVHERTHIRRRDSLVLQLARLNRCVFWFHPLAWWLERKLALLAEQACDEAFLGAGGDRRRYAGLLLEMAVAVDNARGRVYHHALGMASRTRQRIERVLDERPLPCRGLRAKGMLPLLIASVPLVYAAGAIRIERQPAEASFEFPHIPAPSAPKLFAQNAAPIPPSSQVQTAPAYQPVMVPVSVREPLGRYVTGLRSSDFHLLVDGVEQLITGFYSHLPLSLAVVVNTKNDGIPDVMAALTKLRQALTPEDELLLVYARGENPFWASPIDDLPTIAKIVASNGSWDRSVGMDGVYDALDLLRGARHPRRVLAVIDPIQGDDFSVHTESDVETIAQQANIPVYRLPADSDKARQDILAFGAELQVQYILTFTPTHPGFHEIEVRLDPRRGLPPLEARAPTRYYARYLALEK